MIFVSIFPTLIFIAISISLALICKKTFGECLPITLLGSTFIVYLSQYFFSTYNIGLIILVGLALTAIPILIFKRKEINRIYSSVFSWGLFSFLFLVLLFSVLDYNRHFNNWDEYMTWGTMVKESLRLDKFYIVPEANLLNHKEYPPFSTVFELIWCKFSLSYDEGIFTQALHVLQLSMVFPLITEKIMSKDNSSKIITKIISVIVLNCGLILFVLAFDSDGGRIMTNSMVDILFPMIFVYCLLILLEKNNQVLSWFEVIGLVLGCSGLLLVKQVCIAFVLLIWFWMCLGILMAIQIKEKKLFVSKSIRFIPVVFVPLLMNKSWGYLVEKYDLHGQFELSKIKPSEYIASITTDNGLQNATFKSYIRGLFSINVNTFNWALITYASTVIVLLLCISVLFWKSKGKEEKNLVVTVFLTLVAGTFGYAFMMSVMYLFCFTSEEMGRLASFHRYMSSYVIAEMMVLLYLCLIKVCNSFKVNSRKIFVCSCVVILLFGSTNFKFFMPQRFLEFEDKRFEDYGKTVCDNTEPGSKVFIVADSNNMYQFYIGYYANDRVICMDYNNLFGFDFSNEEQTKKLFGTLSENDYMYVIDYNDNIFNAFSEYTLDGSLENNHIYKIVTADSGFMLE